VKRLKEGKGKGELIEEEMAAHVFFFSKEKQRDWIEKGCKDGYSQGR